MLMKQRDGNNLIEAIERTLHFIRDKNHQEKHMECMMAGCVWHKVFKPNNESESANFRKNQRDVVG